MGPRLRGEDELAGTGDAEPLHGPACAGKTVALLFVFVFPAQAGTH